MIATIIIISLTIFNLGLELAKHGQPKEGEHNFLKNLIATLVTYFLYESAGLFDKFF